MFVIVGLGNPGKKYEGTRHNMGFLTIDRIADAHQIKVDKIKHKALVGDGIISGQKVMLVKPQTFMNSSGESVREVVDYYKVPMENLILIYDDIDLPTGALRIRMKGSSGTHNGMKSVIYQIQDDNFPRIRIGIGKSDTIDLINYVTGRVTNEEAKILTETLDKAAEAAICIVTDGVEKAMSKYNYNISEDK